MKEKIVIIVFLFFNVIAVSIGAFIFMDIGLNDWQLPDDISSEHEELPTTKLYADFYFLSKKIEYSDDLYLAAGRIYLPLYETVKALNGQVSENDNEYTVNLGSKKFLLNKKDDVSYPKKIINIDNKDYISMFNLLENSDYKPVFNSSKNRIDIFYYQKNIDNITQNYDKKNPAYLRLEDIMADGIDPDGYYNDIGLEKLRAIADYLYNNNQKFYIAWIPLYKNPSKGIENNLTKDFNLYNASFLYTLDYLTHKGGKIGLHGYTHQYNNDKSADGYEFGKKTPFSDNECVNRLLLAKKTAVDLGYEINFFEFPHYGATNNHLRYAEKYYNVIYQQNTAVKNEGNIVELTKSDGRKIKYVPTPSDYICSRYDTEGINSRIDTAITNRWIVSLFYHPKIDFDVISTKTENNTRICSVPENSSVYKLIEKINSEKLTFNYF